MKIVGWCVLNLKKQLLQYKFKKNPTMSECESVSQSMNIYAVYQPDSSV